ncbi:TRAP transporter small permease [Pararhizobium haloflavum]|uniref:TRAP transporter small permease n=1 Tax=Pararhizobium haloflavum TaxID=2037914 RepID=UPI000C1925F8|nr:TRAP transporter small permease [Pararhizobium haloflavum]
MKAMSTFIVGLSLACRVLLGAVFAVLIATVAIQVFTRTFSASSPIWTEELSRFMLLYLAAFGVGLSYRSGDLVNVDILQEAVSERVSWWMRLLSAAATAGLALVMIGPAWRFTSIGAMQTSPSLRWSMDIIHASVLVLSITLFVFALLRVVGMVAGIEDGRTQFAEED